MLTPTNLKITVASYVFSQVHAYKSRNFMKVGVQYMYNIEVWGMLQKNFEILCHERASGAI